MESCFHLLYLIVITDFVTVSVLILGLPGFGTSWKCIESADGISWNLMETHGNSSNLGEYLVSVTQHGQAAVRSCWIS